MEKTELQSQFVKWFRDSSPYINAHRGKTFVILFNGETVESESFPGLIQDFALLNSLGVKLVLVHGARPQIESRLQMQGVQSQIAAGIRITDFDALRCVKDAVGSVRMDIEAMLSMGVINSPMAGARIRVNSGNYVIAKPLGVYEGVDYCFTGEVRRIDHESIRKQLDAGEIVLLSSVGYSPTGEIFNLRAEEVAMRTASALGADKFIYLTEPFSLNSADDQSVKQLSLTQAKHYLIEHSTSLSKTDRHNLECAIEVCEKGVKRIHLIDRHVAGAVLLELYTRNGFGTLVTSDSYDTVRQATIDDIGGILELIAPLENTGVLVKRSRELLEMEISQFTVIERDGMIIACAALYPYVAEQCAELACLAVHQDYRNEMRGESLLNLMENTAFKNGIRQLFVLTTRSEHWFVERGFKTAEISDLPVEKQHLYNYQRRSKVFIKQLEA